MAEIEIRSYKPGDEEALVRTWNAIFPSQDGSAPRTLEEWRWAYLQNPGGGPEIGVGLVDGEIVGQYACFPMRALKEGAEISLGQLVDAFVLPQHRRAGGRPGLIVHMAEHLHDSYGGPRASARQPGHELFYGLPVPIWRMAQRYLGGEIVRDLDVLFREIAVPSFRPLPLPEGWTVERVPAGDPSLLPVLDQVWNKVAPEVAFGVVRDAAYLQWRYLHHPRVAYDLLLARDPQGNPRGLGVFRSGAYVVPQGGLIVDWIVPREDEEADLALLSEMERRAGAKGLPVLVAVFAQNDPRFLRFQRTGFLVGPPTHFLGMKTYKLHVRWLRDRWFFTLGDTDLV
ncbi:MAG TPA: GNAT family N-acetyltransferase [Planctomycetes bacterium]|nr:GNAT family N-acetyltransferase [Planctomycetota bacterium]